MSLTSAQTPSAAPVAACPPRRGRRSWRAGPSRQHLAVIKGKRLQGHTCGGNTIWLTFSSALRPSGGCQSENFYSFPPCVPELPKKTPFFTCGRRPAVHVMMAVVVVAGGGGEQLLYIGSPRAYVWSSKIQKRRPLIFLFFESPCLD